MKEYDIKITETLEKTVTVKAESMEAAQAKVEEEYYNSEHILDSENFTGVDFSAEAEREIVQEQKEQLDVLLVKPGMYPQAVQIGSELEDLQKAVGGDIEAVYAAEKIAADFGLQYDSHIPYVLPKRTATAVQIQKQRERYTYDVLVRYHLQLQEWLVMCAPDSPESDIDPRYVEAIHQKDYVEYLMDTFLTGSLEERTSLCSERNPNIRRIAHRLAQLRNENKTLSIESISR